MDRLVLLKAQKDDLVQQREDTEAARHLIADALAGVTKIKKFPNRVTAIAATRCEEATLWLQAGVTSLDRQLEAVDAEIAEEAARQSTATN